MLYIILFIVSILLCIPISNFLCKGKAWLETVLWACNIFIIEYLIIAMPMLVMESFNVLLDLIIVIVLNCLIGLSLYFKFKNDDRKKRHIKKIEKQEWVVLGAVILCIPFIMIRAEGIMTNADLGMYFEYAMVLMEGKAADVHTLNELNIISDEVDSGVLELQSTMPALYFDNENTEEPYIMYHSLPTWATLLALFGKMFGLYNCSIAMNYIYILAVLNMYYLCKKIGRSRYSGYFAVFLFALSPIVLYGAKATLTELVYCYIFICAISGLFEKDTSFQILAAGYLGLLGFVHVYTCVYCPIICIILFVFSLDEKYKNFGIVNIIQLILFNISIQYCHAVSGIYTEKQYGMLSMGGRLSFFHISILILGVSLIGIICQWLIIRGKLRLFSIMINWCSERFVYIARIVVVIILSGSVYYGYLLCFTNKLAIEEGVDAGSWNLRSRYINTGITAVSYLNLTNIMRATAIVGIGILLILPFLKRRFSKKQQCVYYILFYSLLMYTFVWVDTPFNFYASRYFLPVILPTVTILMAMSIKTDKWIMYICLLSLLFYRRYDLNFLQGAPYVGQFQIMKDALEQFPQGAVIMADMDNENLNAILINNLRVMNDNLVFNYANKNDIIEYFQDRPVFILSEKQIEDETVENVYNNSYDLQYSFGNGPNGSYATFVATYPVELNIYKVGAME